MYQWYRTFTISGKDNCRLWYNIYIYIYIYIYNYITLFTYIYVLDKALVWVLYGKYSMRGEVEKLIQHKCCMRLWDPTPSTWCSFTKAEVSTLFSSVVNNIWKIYNPDVVKSVLYGKYRTVGTFDVRHLNAINIIIYTSWYSKFQKFYKSDIKPAIDYSDTNYKTTTLTWSKYKMKC